jgi:hypothetical protein
MLEQFGVEDVFTALCRRDDDFLVGNDSHIGLLKVYMLEHYGLVIGAEKFFQLDLGRNYVGGSSYKGRPHSISFYRLCDQGPLRE